MFENNEEVRSFQLGPYDSASLNYGEWLNRAGIPWTEDPKMKQLFHMGLPPEWAHHEYFFVIAPELPVAS